MDIETRPDDTKMKVAVCGWSYRMSAAHVAEEMRKIGVRTVDLAASCPSSAKRGMTARATSPVPLRI